MNAHRIACQVSEAVTKVNSRPVIVLLFPALCGLFILAGYEIGKTELFLLILTTLLSIDASWVNRLQLLARAQDKGEVE